MTKKSIRFNSNKKRRPKFTTRKFMRMNGGGKRGREEEGTAPQAKREKLHAAADTGVADTPSHADSHWGVGYSDKFEIVANLQELREFIESSTFATSDLKKAYIEIVDNLEKDCTVSTPPLFCTGFVSSNWADNLIKKIDEMVAEKARIAERTATAGPGGLGLSDYAIAAAGLASGFFIQQYYAEAEAANAAAQAGFRCSIFGSCPDTLTPLKWAIEHAGEAGLVCASAGKRGSKIALVVGAVTSCYESFKKGIISSAIKLGLLTEPVTLQKFLEKTGSASDTGSGAGAGAAAAAAAAGAAAAIGGRYHRKKKRRSTKYGGRTRRRRHGRTRRRRHRL